MFQFFKHILLIPLIAFFLALSSGVYMTVHHCTAEDFTGLYLFSALTDDPCTHHEEEHDKNSCCENNDDHAATCSVSCEMPDCCSNTILLLAVDDDYVKSDQQAAQVNISVIIADSGLDLIKKSQDTRHIKPGLLTWPPPALSGKELSLINRTLLL